MREREEIYFKELTHNLSIVEAEDPGKNCRSSPKVDYWQNSLFLRSDQDLFYEDHQLISWGPPTLTRDCCFTQSHNLCINISKKKKEKEKKEKEMEKKKEKKRERERKKEWEKEGEKKNHPHRNI